MNIFSRLKKAIGGLFNRRPEIKTNNEPIVKESIDIETKSQQIKHGIEQQELYNQQQARYRQIRQESQIIIDEANKRWRDIEEAGYISKAIFTAMDSNEGNAYFDISQLTNYDDIRAELTRARIFINDITSTLEGAELYTREEHARQYYGKFGNQYNNYNNHYKKFDIYNIDENIARVAFRLYRDIEGLQAAWLQQYGSGESIAMLYDMVEQSTLRDAYPKDSSQIGILEDLRTEFISFLESQYGESSRELEKIFDYRNAQFESMYQKVIYENKDLEMTDTNLYF